MRHPDYDTRLPQGAGLFSFSRQIQPSSLITMNLAERRSGIPRNYR